MVQVETDFVIERRDREDATTAVLLQMAVAGVLDKKGNENFHKQIKKMTEGQ